MTKKLNKIEAKLMSQQPEVLTRTITELQTKTELNRKMAADAREAADAALQNATEVDQVRGPEMAFNEQGRRDLTFCLSACRSGDEEHNRTV